MHPVSALTIAFLTPLFALAGAQDVIFAIRFDLGRVVVAGIGLAMVLFIIGIISFLAGSDNAQAHERGRKQMVWGVVAMFFMVSIWGIVNVLRVMIAPGAPSSCTPTSIDIAGGSVTECL